MQFFPRRCIRYSMKIIEYDRDAAVAYARQWAFARNPQYYDFSRIGGDCTNFASQCLFAGCGVMNFTPTYGWYYLSAEDRAPAWAGVNEFFAFLTEQPEFAQANGGIGPYGVQAINRRGVEVGDFVQLANEGGVFYHSLIISELRPNEVLVCAQSDDALDRPLSSYTYASLRVLHVLGARLSVDNDLLAKNVFDAISLPMHRQGEI